MPRLAQLDLVTHLHLAFACHACGITSVTRRAHDESANINGGCD